MSAFAAASWAALAIFQSGGDVSIAASIAAFEAACLDIRGDRAKLQELATINRWRPSQAELHPAMDWMDVYEVGSTFLKLAHVPKVVDGDSITPEQVICSLDGIEASADWVQALSAIEVDEEALGAPNPLPRNYDIPPGLEMGVWFLPDDSRLHGSYISAQRRLEISINYPPEF